VTIIVGYGPDERGRAALHLAGMLARSAGESVVVCSVVPRPWMPSMAKVDAEYQAYLDSTADDALERARSYLPEDVDVTYERHRARSGPAGLLELAEKHGADLVVLGSSSDGVFGHIALGSVTDRLLHSATMSVALANRGFRCKPDARVVRVTAAYGTSESADQLVLAAADVAARMGASLRVASFAVWSRPDYPTRLGTDTEDAVWDEWRALVARDTEAALAQVATLPRAPTSVESVIGQGDSWAAALDDLVWDEGDVLLLGSSGVGAVSQVFLGSRASKILRHSPVPVLVVPRERAEVLARRAAAPSVESPEEL